MHLKEKAVDKGGNQNTIKKIKLKGDREMEGQKEKQFKVEAIQKYEYIMREKRNSGIKLNKQHGEIK